MSLHDASLHAKLQKNRELGTLISSFSSEKGDTLVISDYFGLVSDHKEDKLLDVGVRFSKSSHVDAPILEDYPLVMECKVVSIREELGETRVVGEIVNTQAEESILDENGKVDLLKMGLIFFDSEKMSYRSVGEEVGKVFHDGNKLKQ